MDRIFISLVQHVGIYTKPYLYLLFIFTLFCLPGAVFDVNPVGNFQESFTCTANLDSIRSDILLHYVVHRLSLHRPVRKRASFHMRLGSEPAVLGKIMNYNQENDQICKLL